jgi:nucleoside-diphosphate-sugar epimerase
MQVLVTGATGYAGFYAAIALRQAGHQVYGLVRDDSKPRAQELRQHEVNFQDLAEAYVRVVESGAAVPSELRSALIGGEVFCIADEQRFKCLEIMQACLNAAGYTGNIDLAEPQEDDVTSVWFNQNEFITSRKAHRILGWSPRHSGIIDEIETYYASWKASQADGKGGA